jgi:hypothetical protein
MGATRRDGRLGVPEVFALIGAASFAAARFLPLLDLHLECPFRAVTGLPCASCGMTHAFVALSRGDLAGAWAASPLGAGLAGGAWLYAVLDLARVAVGLPWPSLPQRASRALAAAALSAAALNWAWLLWRARTA